MGSTYVFWSPHIVLLDSLEAFVLRTHVLARSNRCDCFGECTRSIWIGEEAVSNGILALIFACLSELEGNEEEYVSTKLFQID